MNLTNQIIGQIAREQLAIDLGCSAEDFLLNENKVVISAENDKARRYLQLPFSVQLVSYGRNIVASVAPHLQDIVCEYINRFPAEHCFETPNLHFLDDALAPFHLRSCFMAEYFLPDMHRLIPLGCPLPVRTLNRDAFAALYLPAWQNALCAKRPHLDMIAVGAYDGDKLIGLAGASADCENMWQIGIDVLPDYRQQGIAAALTSRLACEIIARGKVPFYCAAWSNIASVRCAIRSGFRPAWVELTAKSNEFVHQMNHS